MRKNLISLESLEDIPIDQTCIAIHNPDEIMENNFMAMQEQANNINNIQDSIEEAIDVTTTLESIANKLDNSQLTRASAKCLNTAIEHLCSRTGYNNQVFPALEAFGGITSKAEGTKIALEFIKQTVVAIWDAIVAAIKTVISWIVRFIKWFFGVNNGTKSKLDKTEKNFIRFEITNKKAKTFTNDWDAKWKKDRDDFDKWVKDMAEKSSESNRRHNEEMARLEEIRKQAEERRRKAKEAFDEKMRKVDEQKASRDILSQGIRPGQDQIYKSNSNSHINESGILIAKGASFSNFFGNATKDSNDYIRNFSEMFPKLISEIFTEVEDATGAINIASKKWIEEIKKDGIIEINSNKYPEQSKISKIIEDYSNNYEKLSSLTSVTKQIFCEKFLQQNPHKNLNNVRVIVMPFDRTIFYILDTSDFYFPGMKTGIIKYDEGKILNNFLPALDLEDAKKVKQACENVLKINTHNKKIADCEDTLNRILETFKSMPNISQKSAKAANAIKNVVNATMVSMCNFMVYKEKTVNHGLDYCNASISARITYLEQAMKESEKEFNDINSSFEKEHKSLLAA